VLFSGSEAYLQAWLGLPYSIRTGKPAWERNHGSAFFDYLQNHREQQAVFDAAMTSLSGPEAEALVEAYDFSALHKVLDVGGGHGTLLASILKRNPTLRGGIFEQLQVLESARSAIQCAGLSDRCEFVAGNFFDSIPEGYDAYLLKYVIHDWSDDNAIRILRNCRQAMSERSKLLLMEMINSPVASSEVAAVSDLEMLVLLGGQERSEQDFASLLGEASFRLNRILPTRSPLSILEALPIVSESEGG